jgi:hypothetical protein
MPNENLRKVEEWAMCALGSLVVVGFFAISITFFVGSLLFLAVALREAWKFLF